MKSLIIAEKPSVAADLARALGKIHKKGDHYENDEYVISSAVGHLVELEMPEDIDKKKYGFWRLETLPIIPHKFGLKPIADSKDRFGHLKKLLARKDIDLVINACDAGREGELIFTYIYQLTKCKLPFKRAWMQTMTNEGILEAFKHLRDGADGRPGRRRPLPQRERLAHRHQRHPRPDQAHVRLPRRQCRLRRPRPDPHPRHRLQPRAGDPQFQAPRPTGASPPSLRALPRASTRASTSAPISRRRKRRARPHRPRLGRGRRPRPSIAACSRPARRPPSREEKEGQQIRPALVSTTLPPCSARPTVASALPAQAARSR
jgi:hypothetical protein